MKRQLRGDLIGDLPKKPSIFCLDPFHTRASSKYKKSARLPIKGDGPALVKGIDFREIYCSERNFWLSFVLCAGFGS
jgi:hypothetical protein